ncbi:MAG: hypothetical protein ACR2ML_01005 [Solirubrobacteraceae bacterium]
MTEAVDFETLLRRALVPIEPPDELTKRLEGTLVELTELAAYELEAWELSAMRDPRNWVRPAVAGVVGGTAAAALVVVRVRRRHERRRPPAGVAGFAKRALRDVAEESRRIGLRYR